MVINELETEFSVNNQIDDAKTRNDLVLKNIRLAYYFVNQYRNRGIPFNELLSAGYMGLFNAAQNYKPEKGPFGVCAGLYIKQSIFKEFRSMKFIKLSSNRAIDSFTVRKIRERLEQKLKREPFLEEIAEEAKFSIAEVEMVLKNESEPVSIYHKASEEGAPLIDTLQPVSREDEPELQSFELQERLQKLSKKERLIIHCYLWEEETLEEIGRKLGSNRETVRLSIKKVVKKLKKS